MRIKLFTLPNMITLLNLLAGCLAAFFAFRGGIQLSFWLICAAAVFDFLDGFAARLLKAYSPVGKQLDSLADVISFGFAPAAILLETYQMANGAAHWGFAMFLLAGFSALRLAKFNVDETQSDEFRGLPTPACALLVASAGWMAASGEWHPAPWMLLAGMAALCALLVSDVRMFSLKFHAWGLRENALRYGFLFTALLALVILKIAAVPFVILGYIVVSMVRNGVCPER